jgi:glutaredoxin
MNNYYIKAILLDNCSYSIAAKQMLDNFKIPYKYTIIYGNEKNNHVNDMIDTFPQLYLRKHNTFGNLLIGGYDDMNHFIQTFKSQQLNDENIKKFMDKYKWSKKATLRFIQLIN